MSDRRYEQERNQCQEDGLEPEAKIEQLESYIKRMKEEIKNLKKIDKHKEKIEELEKEKRAIVNKKSKRRHKHH